MELVKRRPGLPLEAVRVLFLQHLEKADHLTRLPLGVALELAKRLEQAKGLLNQLVSGGISAHP